jgi:hypothetical protein
MGSGTSALKQSRMAWHSLVWAGSGGWGAELAPRLALGNDFEADYLGPLVSGSVESFQRLVSFRPPLTDGRRVP